MPRLCLCSLIVFALCLTQAYATTDLPATISGNLALTAAGAPYMMRSDVTIAAGVTVSVDPGVSVIADGDWRLLVNGTLQAAGTAEAPATFRSRDALSRGTWKGLYVVTGGRCLLAYATIQNAACGVTAPGGVITLTDSAVRLCSAEGIYAWGRTNLTCQRCQFSDNTGRGIYLEGFEAYGGISACAFSRHGSYPVQLKATLAEMLKSGNSYSDDGIERIGVSCSLVSDLADHDLWRRQGIPFELGAGGGDQTLTITPAGRLVLEAGTRVCGGRIECKGRLEGAGSSELPILFTSSEKAQAPGDWGGLTFSAGSTGTLSHADIAWPETGLTVDDAQVTLRDSLIRNARFDGARLTGASTVTISGNTFRDCGRNGLRLEGSGCQGSVALNRFIRSGEHPVWAVASQVRLLRSGNRYTDNAIQRIGVSCAASPDLSDGEHVWTAQRLPWDCTVNPLSSILQIASGAKLVLAEGETVHSGGIDVRGEFEVLGGPASPTVFLPAPGEPTPGAWIGIRFLNGGTGRLQGATVQYAQNAVTVEDTAVRLRDCALRDSQYDGLRCEGATTVVVTGTHLVNNGRHGVYVTESAAPNLGNLVTPATTDDGRNTLSGNAGYEIYNNTANAIRAQNNTWASNDSAAIEARIFDRQDLSTKGRVTTAPVYSLTGDEAPTLTFTGETGYMGDGVNPEVVAPGAAVEFRVRYADAQAQPPTQLAVHVADAGAEIEGSPFAMALRGEPTYAAGVVFRRSLALPAGQHYTYWFSATDGANEALGEPTTPRTGPVVDTRPRLMFTGQQGFSGDGVNPESGTAGTRFTFRCLYVDADGDEPQQVLCHLLLGGAELAGGPFVMRALSAASVVSGRVYQVKRILSSPGQYTVFFEATDGVRTATGRATAIGSGPTVTAPGAGIMNVTATCSGPGLIETRCSAGSSGSLDLEIHNLVGRKVAVLCQGRPVGPAAEVFVWEARDAQRRKLPPGVYLLKLAMRSSTGTRSEMILPLHLR